MAGLIYTGSLTIGQCVPTLLQASVTLKVPLLKLQAKLAAALALKARLTLQPPTLATNLQVAIDLVASLQASIALGLPGIEFQLAAVAQLIAQIQLEIGELSFALELDALLGAAGIHAYAYTGGRADQFGPEFAAATSQGFPGGQPNDETVGVVFAATAPSARVALQTVFANG